MRSLSTGSARSCSIEVTTEIRPLIANEGKSLSVHIHLGMGFTFDDNDPMQHLIAEMGRLISKDSHSC